MVALSLVTPEAKFEGRLIANSLEVGQTETESDRRCRLVAVVYVMFWIPSFSAGVGDLGLPSAVFCLPLW